jgi:3-deoxy-D-manno-octulosonic acid kinase
VTSAAAFARGPGRAVLYDPALVSDPGPDLMLQLAAAGVTREEARRGRAQVLWIGRGESQWVLRHYRRGGWIGRWIDDRYAWLGEDRTRSFREWRMLARLHGTGLPVPRPVAAGWHREGWCYRADLVTVRIPEANPLSERIGAGDAIDWHGIGDMLARFHAAGACHADLNAHNILLDGDGKAWLLDFDRGRFRAPGPWRSRNLARLERSLRKIASEPGMPGFSEPAWAALQAGYREGWDLGLRARGP